jgi:hypothetical protein
MTILWMLFSLGDISNVSERFVMAKEYCSTTMKLTDIVKKPFHSEVLRVKVVISVIICLCFQLRMPTFVRCSSFALGRNVTSYK